MSFVGPRPERPFFVAELARDIPFYQQRHAVKPGLTGWAQVKCRYGSSREDAMEKLRYDLYYIKHLSVFFDLTIVFDTVKVVLFRKGGMTAADRQDSSWAHVQVAGPARAQRQQPLSGDRGGDGPRADHAFNLSHLGAAEYGLWVLLGSLTVHFSTLELGYGSA